MSRRSFDLLVLVALTTATLMAQRDIVGRQVPRKVGTHLRDMVRPDDKSIVLIDGSDGPLTITPSDDVSRTQWLFELADGVVLARVDRRRGRLTPAGDWVQSDVTATVLEVFKAPKGANARPNSTIAFVE